MYMSTIDEVKARLDIVETVRAYAPDLKKAGRTWKARCPFHSERTPSFNVDPERQTWHCFGACSTGGDVIEFVRRKEGLDFKEALRLCAERAGVELRPPSPRETEEREQHARLLAANEAAAVFFQAALAGPDGADARAYATGRGLDDATISTWQLGYAPAGWSGLVDHLVARGFTEADLVDAGLALRGERGLYDRFRDRLIFPTRDARRRLIGFGARAMRPDDEPKYLNTPQTPLFDKSANLYGLDRAADAIRRSDRAVVVEGYMDVIGAHQFGYQNVVASNGTSLTEKQIGLLGRYTDNIVLFLDVDVAGSAAMQKGGQLAREMVELEGTGLDLAREGYALVRAERTKNGHDDRSEDRAAAYQRWAKESLVRDLTMADIRVARISSDTKEDPDSLVRKDPKRFEAIVNSAQPVMDFLFEKAGDGIDLSDPRQRSHVVERLVELLADLKDPIVKSHYVQKAARIGQVDERTVLTLLAQRAAGRPRPVATSREVAQAKKQPSAPPDGETQLLRLLFQRREARGVGVGLDHDTFEDSVNRALFAAWAEDVDLEEHLDDLDESLRERHALLMADALPDYDARHIGPMVEDMARRLRLGRAAQRLRTTAVEQAQSLRAARLGVPVTAGAAPGEDSDSRDAVEDRDGVKDEFEHTVQRQRELTRAYQIATGRRSAGDGDPGKGGQR